VALLLDVQRVSLVRVDDLDGKHGYTLRGDLDPCAAGRGMVDVLAPKLALLAGYSTLYYRLMPESDAPSLMPELLVEPTIDDLRRGRDPVLEAATSWSGR
jgi:hypothetical protein